MKNLNIIENLALVNERQRELGLPSLELNQVCKSRETFSLFNSILHSITRHAMKKHIPQ